MTEADVLNPPPYEAARGAIENLDFQVALGNLAEQLRDAAARGEIRARLADVRRAFGAAAPPAAEQELAALERVAGAPRPSAKRFRQHWERLRAAVQAVAPAEAAAPAAPERTCATAAVNELAQDPQLLADFFLESREHLANIEGQLVTLEQQPDNHDAVHSVFRGFHTIKGLAGFLEFQTIQEVAHEVETLLDLARNAQLTLTPDAIDVILASCDYLERWFRHLEAGGNGGRPEDPGPLLSRVREIAAGEAAAEAAPAAVPVRAGAAAVEEAAAGTRQDGAKVVASVVKVETAKLEFLVDMVGELVIAQAMVQHDPDLAVAKSPRLQRNMAQLKRVTGEVQRTAMAMRMVPIGGLFRRMTRLVRDLARKSGKLANLEMSGEDVELDRRIVEELADPFVHMLRNSVDHGLEQPAGREAAGKPAQGKVTLRAWHQAGQIMIEVSDDGRGLDRAKILRKAVERGLVEAGKELTDGEIFNLIFQPGFSTSDRVTDVSGRGVGMDVVRKQVERLRGRIDITSEPGRGTTFILKLPLTLAIIDGLVVKVGVERYILPIYAVREMFRPTREMLFTVEQKGEMALVREQLLPVLRLYRRLGVTPRSEDPCAGLLVVSESRGRLICLLVDEMIGKQEVVIKGLGEVFAGVEGIAGGAIMGDGRVGLILDLATLVRGRTHGGTGG